MRTEITIKITIFFCVVTEFKHKVRLVVILLFNVRILHAVAFSKKLLWVAQTNVITLKTQMHAIHARWKRVSQLGFTWVLPWSQMFSMFYQLTIFKSFDWNFSAHQTKNVSGWSESGNVINFRYTQDKKCDAWKLGRFVHNQSYAICIVKKPNFHLLFLCHNAVSTIMPKS